TATFQWTTSQPATTQIEYGPTTALGASTTLDPSLVTSHQQTITNLNPGTTYFYRLAGTNSFGLTGHSTVSSFTVTALPVISNVATSGITPTAATISWSTDQPTTARVDYGTTVAYDSTTTLDPSLGNTHQQTLTSL